MTVLEHFVLFCFVSLFFFERVEMPPIYWESGAAQSFFVF